MTERTDFFQRLLTLQHDGKLFAVATVVSRRPPVSAHLGDRAVIFADGAIDGFIGGACSREIVRQQALEALRLQQARLVSITPDATEVTTNAGHVVVPMTCASEGAVEIYIEPFMPAPALVVVGETPVADALARLARAMNYAVTQVVESRDQSDAVVAAEALGITIVSLQTLEQALHARPYRPAVVVASQGHYDEEALAVALASGSPYVGLLASRQRGATVRAYLESRGVSGVDDIHSPVGLDIGARTPQEVALSILAEIVREGAAASVSVDAPPKPPTRLCADPATTPEYAVDPVCGMNVATATARHTAEYEGVVYYFCCPHCRAAFVEHPQDYLHTAR